jgi:membrane protein YqaA with SNARE-associated domain
MKLDIEHNPPWYKWPSVWMKKTYNWVMHWANTPQAVPALFGVAFIESSFFPIPPDVLLMAMALSKPQRAFYYALICSAGSVLGGLFGYVLGHFFWELVHPIFIPHVFKQEVFDMVRQKFDMYSFWVVFIAAFTPIPYKVFTIAAGVCSVNLPGFILASIIGRSGRFFLVAATLYFFGEQTRNFITKNFEWLTIAFSILLILGFVCVKNFM